MMNRLFVFLTILVCVLSHSYLTNPVSRSNQKQTQTGCRGPQCLGPCDTSKSNSGGFMSIQRGGTINLQWPRNNHAGGFIRVAWAPFDQSDSHAAFDSGATTYSCHERGGCFPDSPSNPNGGDSGPANGASRACSLSVSVPLHLSDGRYTLQWAWFGGAFALGDYYSCADYQVSGGPTGAAPTPTFIGGDYTYPGQQKCKFFITDRLHRCVNEPCNNPVYGLEQERSGAVFGINNNPTPTPTTVPTAPTTVFTQETKVVVTSEKNAVTQVETKDIIVTSEVEYTESGMNCTSFCDSMCGIGQYRVCSCTTTERTAICIGTETGDSRTLVFSLCALIMVALHWI